MENDRKPPGCLSFVIFVTFSVTLVSSLVLFAIQVGPTHFGNGHHLPTLSPSPTAETNGTHAPTHVPTHSPTHVPTHSPTHSPTHAPTHAPTPTHLPTHVPTHVPTHQPTHSPTVPPTPMPTHEALRVIEGESVDAFQLPSGFAWQTFLTGSSIAVDDAGLCVVVGSQYFIDFHVYVICRSGTSLSDWAINDRIRVVPVSYELTHYAGRSVDMSGDGLRIAVGVAGHAGNRGRVVAFRRDHIQSRIWHPMLEHDSEVDGALLGWSVSLSRNGQVLAAGAPGENGGDGRVHLFKADGNFFNALIPSTVQGGLAAEAFGSSVGLSGSGTFLVVGAPNATNDKGLAYVLWANGARTLWTMGSNISQPLSDVAGDHWASAVAVASDGDRVLVTNQLTDSAWSYDLGVDGVHSNPLKLTSPSTGALFGASVALSETGGNAIVGAPNANSYFIYAHSAQSNQWTLLVSQTLETDANAKLGYAVDLSTCLRVAGAPAYASNEGAIIFDDPC